METPKRNTGGKGEVVFDTRQPPRMPYKAFQIENCSEADLHPPLVTMESKIAEFEETARRHNDWKLQAEEKANAKDAAYHAEQAKIGRAKAEHWRKLASLPEAEAESVDWQCWEDASEQIDFLIARGEHCNTGSGLLCFLVQQALRGLNALAAHGNKCAAMKLIDSLVIGVKDFELMAMHKPEVFTHYTSTLALTPATISPQSGVDDECRELMRKLKIGTESLHAVIAKGKGNRWQQTKPVNALAMRLFYYMDSNRSSHSFIYKRSPQHFRDWPEWFSRLIQLPKFAKKTRGEWAEMGWTILLERTGGKPEDNSTLRPIGESAAKKTQDHWKTLGEKTKASNVKAKIHERLKTAFQTMPLSR